MIEADLFISKCAENGSTFFTGVPCSLLKPLINEAQGNSAVKYIAAVNEGEAAAIAAGGFLAGCRPVVLLQNSGLGNLVNPLTSLLHIYKIPLLFIISHRGIPGGNDAPQHRIMGKITEKLLDLLEVKYRRFPSIPKFLDEDIRNIFTCLNETNLSAAYIYNKGDAAEREVAVKKAQPVFDISEIIETELSNTLLSREEAVAVAAAVLQNSDLAVSTTGKISRELFKVADRAGNFYMQGSMGCAAGIGLGLSLNQKKRVIVFDGDGAALMKLGSLATIGYYQPDNYLHIVFDNLSYDSTGGQQNVSPAISFARAALECNYKRAATVSSKDDFTRIMELFLKEQGPSMIHILVQKGSASELGRPTLCPEEIKERFMNFVKA